MNKRVLTILTVLVVITVCVVLWNVALAMPTTSTYRPPPPEIIEYNFYIIAKPYIYWDLTDPDDIVLAAIMDSGTFKTCYRNETTFLEQVEEHGNIWKVRYGDSYYDPDVLQTWEMKDGLTELNTIHVSSVHFEGPLSILGVIFQFYPLMRTHLLSGFGLAVVWAGFGVAQRKKKL